MKVVLLTPRRSDGGVRDRLWGFSRNWWPEMGLDWPHHVGEDTGPGPFCRGRLINQAAEAAGDWDVAVIVDGDVVIDPRQVRQAVDRASVTERMVLPYDRYVSLSEKMTGRVLDGFNGSWLGSEDPTAGRAKRNHVSSVVVVPRVLWDRVGGFDPAFEGWGPEDRAFHRACEIIGGKVDRVRGPVFHLHHPWSPERDENSRLLQAGEHRYRRYRAASTPAEIHAIRDEPEPNGVLVAVMGHGRLDCLKRAIASIDDNVTGQIADKVITDDSGDDAYRRQIAELYPDWTVIGDGPSVGFGAHVRRLWNHAGDTDAQWLFTVEEDFTFNRPVDLGELALVMNHQPHLVQMALRRQAWFPKELAAGGVVEQHPDKYTDHSDGVAHWLEHRLFFTTNPALVRIEWIRRHPWPPVAHSESVFSRKVLRSRVRAGYWGARTDAPWVTHDGERVGTGY